jgi:hypothetical protein
MGSGKSAGVIELRKLSTMRMTFPHWTKTKIVIQISLSPWGTLKENGTKSGGRELTFIQSSRLINRRMVKETDDELPNSNNGRVLGRTNERKVPGCTVVNRVQGRTKTIRRLD